MTFKRFMYAYFGRGWIVLVLVMSIYAIALSLSVFGLSALGAKEDARHHGRKQDFSWKAGFTKRKSQNFASENVTAEFVPSAVKLEIETSVRVTVKFSSAMPSEALLLFDYEEGGSRLSYQEDNPVITPIPNITVPSGATAVNITITGKKAGALTVGVTSPSQYLVGLGSLYLRVGVVHNLPLVTVNAVIGWIYFVAWSISFYPQIVYNWLRKSVVGLNFDFLAYNLIGFLAYGIFNIGMYWIDDIKNQYHTEHPRGVNPVQLNDVIFTLHALVVTAFTIGQCFFFERGGQRVSRFCLVLLSCCCLFTLLTLFLAVGHVITWLQYVYYFSYIKLGVTLIKYIPQALMNYRRKSTEGWSIGNVLLDFTGGSFSLLQMFLISYNNDDWGSIFGDPTKFGLGLFSILFDILFMVQHYVLYRGKKAYEVIDDAKVNTDSSGDASSGNEN